MEPDPLVWMAFTQKEAAVVVAALEAASRRLQEEDAIICRTVAKIIKSKIKPKIIY